MKHVILQKSEDFFTYDDMANQKWRELTHEVMKTFNVYFDLENDNPMSKRVIIIPEKEWEFTKCKFRCRMYSAGGDWQYPVRYFRCQLVDGYAFGIEKYRSSGMFIYIPKKTEGNYHLIAGKTGSGKWYAPDSQDYKKGIDPEPNDRDCWKALNNYLKELVDKEIEEVQAGRV